MEFSGFEEQWTPLNGVYEVVAAAGFINGGVVYSKGVAFGPVDSDDPVPDSIWVWRKSAADGIPGWELGSEGEAWLELFSPGETPEGAAWRWCGGMADKPVTIRSGIILFLFLDHIVRRCWP